MRKDRLIIYQAIFLFCLEFLHEHNLLLADSQGRRIPSIILQAGSIVPVYETKVIAVNSYYALTNDLNLATSDVQGCMRWLKHRALLYDSHGKRIYHKKALKAHQMVKTYGEPSKIHGQHYFQIGRKRWLKVGNFANGHNYLHLKKSNIEPGKRLITHAAYLYDINGKHQNKVILAAKTRVNVEGTKKIKGNTLVDIGSGYYINAANIE
ncbi:SLAP domain-containing protein [Lactobacillus sp. ESL0785]|uniref:SLAP domain-containing protein n=1 Tax=Lactobacillus sp. ESL0785 TaxID=2983232 RepID=UPI0023F793AB|nr:SLAP domain-containing protein [Lactobacillus sp. ESL0785]WEV70390.1 SLAP domain-containing protein [Lactobacillus sp. ESL0785]